jgi:hypothetical protein
MKLNITIPEYSFRFRKKGNDKYIFDIHRKKFVRFTPEEWTRQRFIRFLVETHNYPASLITIEKGLEVSARSRRTDIVVYSRQAKPWMLIECKSPVVALNKSVLEQAELYHSTLNVNYLVVTNGLIHFAFAIHDRELVSITSLPFFGQTVEPAITKK